MPEFSRPNPEDLNGSFQFRFGAFLELILQISQMILNSMLLLEPTRFINWVELDLLRCNFIQSNSGSSNSIIPICYLNKLTNSIAKEEQCLKLYSSN